MMFKIVRELCWLAVFVVAMTPVVRWCNDYDARQPRLIRCRIGDTIISEFWTCDPRYRTVAWETNLSSTGFVYTSRIVTNRFWK